MLLKQPGDSCLIDFIDIVSWLARELKKYDVDFTRRDRHTCSEVVYSAIDNFFTEHLTWTKRSSGVAAEYYLRMMPVSIDRHPAPYDLAEEMVSKVGTMIHKLAEFPSWHYFYLHRHLDQVSIEMGIDYRIDEFMKEHGKEYGCGENSW